MNYCNDCFDHVFSINAEFHKGQRCKVTEWGHLGTSSNNCYIVKFKKNKRKNETIVVVRSLEDRKIWFLILEDSVGSCFTTEEMEEQIRKNSLGKYERAPESFGKSFGYFGSIKDYNRMERYSHSFYGVSITDAEAFDNFEKAEIELWFYGHRQTLENTNNWPNDLKDAEMRRDLYRNILSYMRVIEHTDVQWLAEYSILRFYPDYSEGNSNIVFKGDSEVSFFAKIREFVDDYVECKRVKNIYE